MRFLGSRAIWMMVTLLTVPSEYHPAAPLRKREPATYPSITHDTSTRTRQLRGVFEHGLDRLDADLLALQQPHMLHSVAESRRAFRKARSDYKHIEGLLEFYGTSLVVVLNGTETAEDDDQPPVNPAVPKGFPLIESILFATPTDVQRRTVVAEIVKMRAALREFRAVTSFVVVTNAQRLEIARTEIACVSTLGIAGFDATASGDGISESAAALEGTRWLFTTTGAHSDQRPAESLQRAIDYLHAHPQFDQFDRLTFLTQYANPAAHDIGDAQRALAERPVLLRRAWVLEASSVFDANAIDAHVYAPGQAPRPTPALIALGRVLFFDPALSGNGQRACASCHRPEQGFTDGLPRARPFGEHMPLTRHTPSLVNAAYQPAQFADERAASIEQQISVVLASSAEMHSSLANAAAVLRQSDDYQHLFARTFDIKADTVITGSRLQIALAAYVRSLSSLNSRFDRAIRSPHNTTLLSAAERHGFNLFMGKGRCGTCHFAPLFNGTAPPSYLSSEVEVIGVPAQPAVRNGIVDPDSGRAAIDHVEGHLHAFKTPTVRNVTLAKTYMHSGVFHSLAEVLDFYNRGGGVGIGARVPNATLAGDPLHLSAQERGDIIAFLGTLVDTVGMTARPYQLPRFTRSTRSMDRTIGGRY